MADFTQMSAGASNAGMSFQTVETEIEAAMQAYYSETLEAEANAAAAQANYQQTLESGLQQANATRSEGMGRIMGGATQAVAEIGSEVSIAREVRDPEINVIQTQNQKLAQSQKSLNTVKPAIIKAKVENSDSKKEKEAAVEIHIEAVDEKPAVMTDAMGKVLTSNPKGKTSVVSGEKAQGDINAKTVSMSKWLEGQAPKPKAAPEITEARAAVGTWHVENGTDADMEDNIAVLKASGDPKDTELLEKKQGEIDKMIKKNDKAIGRLQGSYERTQRQLQSIGQMASLTAQGIGSMYSASATEYATKAQAQKTLADYTQQTLNTGIGQTDKTASNYTGVAEAMIQIEGQIIAGNRN